MDWHSLAMKRTELRRAGLGAGSEPDEATASSERIQDRMSRTHARQRSRRVSSTAAASVKRLKDDAVLLPVPELFEGVVRDSGALAEEERGYF